MTKSKLKVLVIDDEKQYRDNLAEKLSNAELSCTAISPPQTPTSSEIVEMRPNAVLVDYQLTQKPKNSTQPAVAYLGSLLVAAIREKLPSTPIILLTRSKLANQGSSFLERAADLDDAFDDLIFKETVEADIASMRTKIRSLVHGYTVLGSTTLTWKQVVTALKTPAYAVDELRRFGSPGAAFQTEVGFRPAAAARWIRKTMLRFPGLLINELEAATEVGITVASFRRSEVSELFSSARYIGAFALEEDRWWRGELRRKMNTLETNALDADSSTPFLTSWNAAHPKVKVVASKCCVCGLPTSDAICFELKKPVMLRCSLPFYPDNRPSGFDVARISFKAIRESELDEAMFASNVLPLVRKIESE